MTLQFALCRLLFEQHVSPSHIAKLVGVSDDFLAYVEDMDVVTLDKICSILNAKPSEILAGFNPEVGDIANKAMFFRFQQNCAQGQDFFASK